MTSKQTRRQVLSALAAFGGLGTAAVASAPTTAPFPAARPANLGWQPPLYERILATSGLSGEVSFAVASVTSGQVLQDHQADLRLPPASVAKALTALYALDSLGAEHRFVTRLLATAPIADGVLDGDLILAGGADPTLDTDDLAQMALALKQAGLREVRGRFVVYDGLLPFSTTIDFDQPEQVGYSPAVSGIALNFNRVHFEWQRDVDGYKVTMDARTQRYRPDVAMARMRIAERSSPIYTYADKGNVDEWTVARPALGAKGARWLPVRKPGLYAGDVFRTLARSNGIILKPAETTQNLPAADALVLHNSEPLRVILQGMLRYSNNLTAEMVGMAASRSRGMPAGSIRGSAQVMSRWAAARYGMVGTSLVDHSGLGGASRMTALDLTRALVQVRQRGVLRPLLRSFPLVDAQGRPIKDHLVKVDAKTGTLNFVSGLGGFLTTASGQELAFAIFAADVPRREALPRAQRERPEGGRTYATRARRTQRALLEHWGALDAS
ncbi:MAG: D-alanyl-D-alanine carboxypeptidase/D-alanyl-D-alanine-endopeptidase [Pseudomonadota bacterium]